jgi:integrase
MRDWLETYDIGKAKKTRQAMARVLKNFHTYSDGKIPTAKDVTVAHVAGYWQWELDHSPTKSERTTFGRLVALNKFLVDHDVSVIGRGKNQWRIPSFDEKLIEIYEPEEVKALLAASDPRHRAAYTTMYQGLFRDQEVVYLGWADVDSTRCILHVRSKPQYGFRVKKCHERSVTVPRALVDLIMSLPHHGPLVFADDNKPDHDLLSDLKTIAKKAGVDPKRAKLHSFRRTGATHYAQKGLPLPELMRIGGWRDLKSVQRYLGHMHQDRLSTLVESAWA